MVCLFCDVFFVDSGLEIDTAYIHVMNFLSEQLLQNNKSDAKQLENGYNSIAPSNKEMDLESVKSSSSNASELSSSALLYIREQMATSLSKIRDLEEQNRLIPILQKQLVNLKEEKRSLECQLVGQKSKSSSPFAPLRISPVHLRSNSFSEIIRPTKSTTMRDIGVMCVSNNRDNYTNTKAANSQCNVGISTSLTVKDADQKLYTEDEFRRLFEAELKGNKKQTRSIGSQMTETAGRREVGNQTLDVSQKIILTSHQSVQTQLKQLEKSTTAKPETKSVGSSDHSTRDLVCDKCRVKKRTVGCGPDDLEYVPISLKLLEGMTSSKTEDKLLPDVMTSSQSSIGTQMGTTVRDAGTQSTLISLSNKFSQSDLIVVKSKPTDTFDLLELKHQSSNTDVVVPIESAKSMRNSSTNTIKTNLNDSGTNTISSTTQESSVNTECVAKRDVATGDSTKSHFTLTCDINYCDSCKEAVRQLAKEVLSPTIVLKSPTNGGHSELSRIPRPSMMSPLQQRRVLKRQDTYTVDGKMTSDKNVEDDRK